MSLLFISTDRDVEPWKEVLEEDYPDVEVEIWPDIDEPERVQFVVLWGQPPHALDGLPNLQAVSSLGAGVDHVLEDKTIPDDLRVSRVVDDDINDQMKIYVETAINNYRMHSFTYAYQQQKGQWNPELRIKKSQLNVGVMGLGQIGLPVAQYLSSQGFDVEGWSNSAKDISGIETYAGSDALNNFLDGVNVLVCLLPLTPETEGIVDLSLFKKMEHPAFLINVARGAHLVEEDLIYAIDKGWIAGAQLDAFQEEPLPEKHAFWNRENIIITPHVAAESDPERVIAQLVENYKRVLSGQPLKNKVNPEKHY